MTWIKNESKKTLLVGGNKGFARSRFRNTIDENLAIAGENTGNFAFWHAIHNIIKDNKIFTGRGERLRLDDIDQGQFDYFILPASNHLRLDADWQGFNNYLKKIQIPIIVLGLGAQSRIDANPLQLAGKLRENNTVVELATIIEEKAVYVGYRGEFSMAVGTALGITRGDVIGCPSLLIDKDPFLGRRLQEQIEMLKSYSSKHARNPSNYLCLLSSPYSFSDDSQASVIQSLLISAAMRDNAYVLQQSGSADALNFVNGNHKAIDPVKIAMFQKRYGIIDLYNAQQFLYRNSLCFFSAHEWMNSMNDMCFSIGPRFHGNMLSIGAGRLGIVIYHDERTLELAEGMGIPRISQSDFITSQDEPNPVFSMLSRVVFDGEKLDNVRRATATKWLALESKTRITLSDHVDKLANS
jgi:hypothetical protein